MIQIVLFSLGTGALSLFVQECMKKGMILGWYGEWLSDMWDAVDRHTWYKYSGKSMFKAKLIQFLLKPLGMCIYCYGSWVFIVLFLANMPTFPSETRQFIGLLLGLGFNFIWIKILEKWIS